jgi:adenosylcobyric acid synthase
MVPPGRALPADADLIVLPGSKATLADLAFLRAQGWDIDLLAHWRRGGRVLGICGGYQMLGRRIADPDGIEGPPGEAPGLGLLDVETMLLGPKVLIEAAGIERATGAAVAGYEMHIGRTTGPDRGRPMLYLENGREDEGDGAMSEDGRVMGCYLHGLFGADAFRAAFLRVLGGEASGLSYAVTVERALDGLAERLEEHLDLDALLAAAR